MSEVLRDLVVSLSLNNENFTRNLKSNHSQIQEAESSSGWRFHMDRMGLPWRGAGNIGASCQNSYAHGMSFQCNTLCPPKLAWNTL